MSLFRSLIDLASVLCGIKRLLGWGADGVHVAKDLCRNTNTSAGQWIRSDIYRCSIAGYNLGESFWSLSDRDHGSWSDYLYSCRSTCRVVWVRWMLNGRQIAVWLMADGRDDLRHLGNKFIAAK